MRMFKPVKKAKQPLLLTDDTLKERFGPSPSFPEKNEKATRIMSLVRKKQAEHQKASGD